MITISSPTEIMIPRKTKADRKISLNLNQYRNLHYQVNNEAKNVYTTLMYSTLKDIKFKNKIDMHFYLIRKGNRIVDSSNIYCIVEKFFCDAMKTYGCIKDDSDKYIGVRTYYPPFYGESENYCNIVIIENPSI